MSKLFSVQKAYSLIELTVSLAIISVLLTISTVGIISLRESLNVNSATQGLYDALQLARSYAINNVTYWDTSLGPVVPTMYVISLASVGSTTPLKFEYCNKGNSPIANTSSCGDVTGAPVLTDVSGVNVVPGSTKPCEEVGFLTGSGDIYVKQSGSTFLNYANGGIAANDICQFEIKTTSGINSHTVTIEVNGNDQTIKKL